MFTAPFWWFWSQHTGVDALSAHRQPLTQQNRAQDAPVRAAPNAEEADGRAREADGDVEVLHDDVEQRLERFRSGGGRRGLHAVAALHRARGAGAFRACTTNQNQHALFTTGVQGRKTGRTPGERE